MGNWPLWAQFLGKCKIAPPILLFLGPGELPKGGPKYGITTTKYGITTTDLTKGRLLTSEEVE